MINFYDFPNPAVVLWICRIQALPGYVGMPGVRQSEQATLYVLE